MEGMSSPAVQQSISTLGRLKLRRPVHDLGAVDERLQGILTPGYTDAEIGCHVHETFLEDAGRYLAFCPIDRGMIDHWKMLIGQALRGHIDFEQPNQEIIDIGSGGGTTVFPTLELFAGSHVVATDLALPLLAEMRNLARRDAYESLSIVQMNGEDSIFEDEQADLVMGAHVLHHALSLETMFREIRRVLRPGKVAVFWEGFEHGAQILASIFDLWIEMDKSRSEHLKEPLIRSLQLFTADLQNRIGRNKPPEVLARLDDKWFFSHTHVRDLAAAAGFSQCEIRNIYGPVNVVRVLAEHELKRWGHQWNDLPNWAQEKLLTIQARYSEDYLNENPFCCSLLLAR